jgi:hypothetical protein
MWHAALVAAMDPDTTTSFLSGPILVGLLVLVVLVVIGMWKVFEKAGQPGWAAIVPIYNACVLAKIAGKEWWWGLLACLPYVGFIFFIFLDIGVGQAFRKSTGFIVGMVLLGFIFYPILGFGPDTYQGKPSEA